MFRLLFESKSITFAPQLNEGTESPLLHFLMNQTHLSEPITQFLAENLDSPNHFLVKVSVGTGKVTEAKVQVLIDSDLGITIEECAVYSRKLGKFLEEKDLFEHAYTLEVASPGLDFPLNTDRQFAKNVGRKLQIDLKEGSPVEGKLLSFKEKNLELEVEHKQKGKKITLEVIRIPTDNIMKAKVIISFK